MQVEMNVISQYFCHFRVMVVGGTDNNRDARTTSRIYDIKTRAWSTAMPMNQGRTNHACASMKTAEGKIVGVVSGGYPAHCKYGNFISLVGYYVSSFYCTFLSNALG